MKIKQKIWLEKNGYVIFGKGRDELLHAINEYQSLYAAAKKLNISYRGAWARLKASEERLKIKLVELHPQKKGMHLTAEGKALLKEYDQMERKVETILKQHLQKFRKITKCPSKSSELK